MTWRRCDSGFHNQVLVTALDAATLTSCTQSKPWLLIHAATVGRGFTVEGYRVLYRVNPDTGRDGTAGDVEVHRIFGPEQSRG